MGVVTDASSLQRTPEVADTRFIAYFYASVLDSHVQGISEAVNQVGLGGGKLSEQSDSSCLILGWQLSFKFPQIFDGEILSRRMWQCRCLRPFRGFGFVVWCVDVVCCVNFDDPLICSCLQ